MLHASYTHVYVFGVMIAHRQQMTLSKKASHAQHSRVAELTVRPVLTTVHNPIHSAAFVMTQPGASTKRLLNIDGKSRTLNDISMTNKLHKPKHSAWQGFKRMLCLGNKDKTNKKVNLQGSKEFDGRCKIRIRV